MARINTKNGHQPLKVWAILPIQNKSALRAGKISSPIFLFFVDLVPFELWCWIILRQVVIEKIIAGWKCLPQKSYIPSYILSLSLSLFLSLFENNYHWLFLTKPLTWHVWSRGTIQDFHGDWVRFESPRCTSKKNITFNLSLSLSLCLSLSLSLFASLSLS